MTTEQARVQEGKHVALDDRVPRVAELAGGAPRTSRFELAPPRHFVLPAILLLLSEEPGYGYRLVKDLEDLHFGRIDRPTVYRALGQLEGDALVESWPEAPTAGQTRRIYGLTPLGARVLRTWMGVIKEERDALDHVLRRYQATGTVDAALAEIDGGWAALRSTWSPVAASAPAHRPRGPVRVPARRTRRVAPPIGPRRFRLVPARSVLLVDVRSSVGPISFGAVGLTGTIDADVVDGAVRPGGPATAHLEAALGALRSSNTLYDAELLRRIDARRYPTATVDVTATTAIRADRYRLVGRLDFHGVTRAVEGAVSVDVTGDDLLVVNGEHAFDIRDFGVASPTVLMLRIYPDVRLRLHLEAEPQT